MKSLFPKVAWTLMVQADKKNATSLNRALASIAGHVDDIFIQLNAPKGKKISPEVRAVAEQFTDKIFDYVWADNFVAARNDLFSKVPKKYDWIGWMDCDDIIDFPEQIWPVTRIMPSNVNCIHIMYDYEKDEYGNVSVALWSARIVRNNGSYHWQSSIDDEETSVHETLVPRRNGAAVSNDEFKIIHMAEPGHRYESLERNIRLLQDMYERQSKSSKGVDPRILYYLGTHVFEAGDFDKAAALFGEYLKVSGWNEERAEAHIYMGKYLKLHNKRQGAKTAFLMALGENPKNPNAYLELGRLESLEQRWEQAATWFKKAMDVEVPLTAMVQFKYKYELLTEYAQALANLGGKNLEEAYKLSQEAFKLRPASPDAEANRDFISKLIRHRDILRGTTKIIKELQDNKEDDKVLPFLRTLPESLKDSPLVMSYLQEYTPSTKWPKKSMAIYCGASPLGNWGPWSLNETGLGGSEEAVVRMSQELTKLGWKVVVYATPGIRAGKWGGVEWKHYWEFNAKDKYDVLISWRQPELFDYGIKFRKGYLWLHDVMTTDELYPERLNNLTKVIYVSKYHSEREESKSVPLKKKFPSANGIAAKDFNALDKRDFVRNPHRCIYMSANERGLRILYDIWEDVLKQVPDATLDIYYGWDSFDAINRDNAERMAWKALMQAKAEDLPGVTEHGRIPQDKLNEEIFQSGIFAYPCTFPEVNCITAQKAMSGGAVPVTSDFAVLHDIIKYGEAVPMHDFKKKDIERYKRRLIWWLNHPEEQQKIRKKMMAWAREEFLWGKTAAQWSEEMQ